MNSPGGFPKIIKLDERTAKLRFKCVSVFQKVPAHVANLLPLFRTANASSFQEGGKLELSITHKTTLEAVKLLFTHVIVVKRDLWNPESMSDQKLDTILDLISLLHYLQMECNEDGMPLCLVTRETQDVDKYEEVTLLGDEEELVDRRLTPFGREMRGNDDIWDRDFYFSDFMITDVWREGVRQSIRRFQLVREAGVVYSRSIRNIEELLDLFPDVPIEQLYESLQIRFSLFSDQFQLGVIQSYCQHCFGRVHKSPRELFQKWDEFVYNWPWLARYIWDLSDRIQFLHDVGTPIKRISRISKCKQLEEVLDYLWARVREDTEEEVALVRVKDNLKREAMSSTGRDRYIAMARLYFMKKR
jgi:hypothetical protein